MSDKKRTTATTIETREVWVIRRAVPELSEVELLTPDEIAQPATVSTLSETDNGPDANEEEERVRTRSGSDGINHPS